MFLSKPERAICQAKKLSLVLILINQYAEMALYNQTWINTLEVIHTKK